MRQSQLGEILTEHCTLFPAVTVRLKLLLELGEILTEHHTLFATVTVCLEPFSLRQFQLGEILTEHCTVSAVTVRLKLPLELGEILP